jgi:ubiquinone/menaquinone biosynthesis C-methylase UbiE
MKHTARVREQFERQARAYAENEVVRDERLLGFLVKVAGVGPADRVLDLACGPGYLTLALAARAARVVGVDVTDRFLAMARAEAGRRGLENVAFVPGDVEALPFPGGSFDLAVCKFAFHHFERPRRVLEEMKRVLAPGGRIALMDMIASEDVGKAARQDEIEKLCDPTHVRALPASEFERMFAGAGLRVRFQTTGESTEELEAWMRHGGPGQEAAARIRALMRESITEDRTGLRVREEDGRIRFTHTGATYVLARAE